MVMAFGLACSAGGSTLFSPFAGRGEKDNTVLQDVKIKLGAEKLVGRGILADASSLDLGAGEIVLADYYSGAAKIQYGMGKVMLEGRMRGRCKLDCGWYAFRASCCPLPGLKP